MTDDMDRPWQVSLDLPTTWFGLTCDEETDRAQVPAAVQARLREEPDLGAGDAMVDVLLGWSASAASLGAAAAAMRWARDETFGMAMATLMLRRLERDPGSLETELQRLRPMLAKQTPADEFAPRVTEVALASGQALRMEAVRQPSDGSQPLRLVIEYWLPMEDIDLVQMSFGTSNLALADELSTEFEFVASTLAVEPT